MIIRLCIGLIRKGSHKGDRSFICAIHDLKASFSVYVTWLGIILVDYTVTIYMAVAPYQETLCMGLLPDTQNCGLRMRWECFPRHRLQRKSLVSDPDMHHGTFVTYVPWCMSGWLTLGGGKNVSRIAGACATRNFAYLGRGPCLHVCLSICVFLPLCSSFSPSLSLFPSHSMNHINLLET